MNTAKRLHPLKLIQGSAQVIANNFVFIIVFFVLRAEDQSTLATYFRIGFILIIGAQLIFMLVKWWKTTYIFTKDSVHQYRGVFKKKHYHIHLEQIQNIQQQTPFYFKPFNVTSLVLNTRSTDSNAVITFEALSNDEASRIRDRINDDRTRGVDETAFAETDPQQETQDDTKSVHVHFTSDMKTLLKASLLSLNLIIVVPILLTIYERMKDVLPLKQLVDALLSFVTKSWMTIGLTGIVLILLSIIIGVVKTFVTYGNYEISSDEDRIFIRSGLLNEKHMSIQKNNVQGIRIYQSVLKKWLGMSEAMLISTAAEKEDGFGVQSLFPFLSSKQANALIQTLLPQFKIKQATNKLPKQALFMKMIRVPWFFLFALAFVLIFKSNWAFILPIIFIVTYVGRYFDYRNSRYSFDGQRIHYYSGGLSSVLFTTNRMKVIEVEVRQSMIQRKLGLATIQTSNKSVPVHEESIADIDARDADQFINWYGSRAREGTEGLNDGLQ